MKRLLCILALTFAPPSCAPAHAQEQLAVEHKADGSVTITLPPEVMAQCIKEGGCQLFSRDAVMQIAAQAVKKHCAKEI
jgi:hypothetical protein